MTDRIFEGFANNAYDVECECECVRDDDDDAHAWVRSHFASAIHFCPSFFLALSAERQAEAFLHEASHVFAKTDDYKYSIPPLANRPMNAHWIDDLALTPEVALDLWARDLWTMAEGR